MMLYRQKVNSFHDVRLVKHIRNAVDVNRSRFVFFAESGSIPRKARSACGSWKLPSLLIPNLLFNICLHLPSFIVNHLAISEFFINFTLSKAHNING